MLNTVAVNLEMAEERDAAVATAGFGMNKLS